MQNVAFSNPKATPHNPSVAEAVVSSLDAAQHERWPFRLLATPGCASDARYRCHCGSAIRRTDAG